MPYLPQQQQPGPIPWLDETEASIHPFVKPVLSAVFAIGFLFYGLEHPRLPLVLYVGLGLILGLVATALLKHLAVVLICAALVAAAAVGTWFLLSNERAIRSAHTAQTAPASPAAASRGLLDDLRKAVE